MNESKPLYTSDIGIVVSLFLHKPTQLNVLSVQGAPI